ncbi:Uncharacterised protein [uncultured archaeon]|nr:Uncharacterised protein [uncultured archaeon]
MDFKQSFGKFWAFLKEDSWPSFFVSLILILIFIKLIFFPALTFLTGSALPVVIVESCSMYHSQSLENIMQDKIYSDYGLSFQNTSDWVLKNGFSKGDIIFVLGPQNVKVGDVIIYNAGQRNPIIHRVINISNGVYTTKGDHNQGFLPFEKSIVSDQIVGKAVFRIPLLGWVKLIFFDWRNPADQRGFCK